MYLAWNRWLGGSLSLRSPVRLLLGVGVLQRVQDAVLQGVRGDDEESVRFFVKQCRRASHKPCQKYERSGCASPISKQVASAGADKLQVYVSAVRDWCSTVTSSGIGCTPCVFATVSSRFFLGDEFRKIFPNFYAFCCTLRWSRGFFLLPSIPHSFFYFLLCVVEGQRGGVCAQAQTS